MGFSVLGINHTTASIELREQVAFLPENLSEACKAAIAHAQLDDIIILSTCNRTEFYTTSIVHEPLLDWIAAHQNISKAELHTHSYSYYDKDALKHLIRVSSGLDSMMLGETQIFGQVKQALQFSRHNQFISPDLSWYFDQAFNTTKYIRSNTGVGELAVSTGLAVVRLTQHVFNHLSQLNALMIGAGEMNSLVAKHLMDQGIGQLTIANRTLENALHLKKQLPRHDDITVLHLNDIDDQLHEFDLICSCTASPHYLVHYEHAKKAIKKRKYKPMVLVDLAVPRDIDPHINQIDDIYLNTIDDLQSVISQNTTERQKQAAVAETMVTQFVDKSIKEKKVKDSGATIGRYRKFGDEIGKDALKTALNALQEGISPEIVLKQMQHTLTTKLMHMPTILIRKLAEQGNQQLLESVEQHIDVEQAKLN